MEYNFLYLFLGSIMFLTTAFVISCNVNPYDSWFLATVKIVLMIAWLFIGTSGIIFILRGGQI